MEGQQAAEEVKRKIIEVGSLPSYSEVVGLYRQIERKRNRWFMFCQENGIHEAWNEEMVAALAEGIRGLGPAGAPVIEVCAGNGKLSYWLARKGVEIKATDSYSDSLSEGCPVERLDCNGALEKYRPAVVVASWIPVGRFDDNGSFMPPARIGEAILDFPSVQYLIDIGEGVGGATWVTMETMERKDWDTRGLKNVERYSLPRTYTMRGPSCVTLFSRVRD